MSDSERMTIEFDFTRDDYLAWCWALQDTGASKAAWDAYRKNSRVYWVVGVAGGICWVWMAYVRRNAIMDARMPETLLMLALAAALVGVWWTIQQRSSAGSTSAVRAKLEQSADSATGRMWQGVKRVTVSPAFLEWEAADSVHLVRWTAVGRMDVRGPMLELEIGSSEQRYPIPLRAFDSEEQRRAFVTLATRYRDQAGGPRREDVAALLKHRDFKCPGCGYNLRGVAKGVCPECGRGVLFGDVVGGGGWGRGLIARGCGPGTWVPGLWDALAVIGGVGVRLCRR